VISHWHKFAVSESVATSDREKFGSRNIADRAGDLIFAYLRLTKALEFVSDAVGAGFTQAEIGELSSDEVEYKGWWTIAISKPIYAVAQLSSSKDQFLARAVDLFKLLELLKPATLRNLTLSLGISKEQVKDFRGVKLLSTICQLFCVANDEGYTLPIDSTLVAAKWDTKKLLPEMNSIFALQSLRILHSHVSSSDKDIKLRKACAALGIDISTTATGWGCAIDLMMDSVTDSLNNVANIIEQVEL
jgi:hypothetical protein